MTVFLSADFKPAGVTLDRIVTKEDNDLILKNTHHLVILGICHCHAVLYTMWNEVEQFWPAGHLYVHLVMIDTRWKSLKQSGWASSKIYCLHWSERTSYFWALWSSFPWPPAYPRWSTAWRSWTPWWKTMSIILRPLSPSSQENVQHRCYLLDSRSFCWRMTSFCHFWNHWTLKAEVKGVSKVHIARLPFNAIVRHVK